MKRGISRLAALAAIVMAVNVALAEDGVLYWMIDSTADPTVTPQDGGSDMTLSDFFGTFGSGSEFAARVRVTGEGVSEDTFLDLYYPGGTFDGEYGVDFDGLDVGTPYGVQAVIPTSYSSGSPEYSFIVEIGNVSDGDWTTIAQSSAETYASLASSRYIRSLSDLGPSSSMQVWTPGQFQAVPEPSGGLLTMMGLALLALRRKRFAEGA